MHDTFTRGASARPRGAWLLAASITASITVLLAACGGGGGDSGGSSVAGPPSTGASIANTSADAARAAQAVVGAGDAAVARRASLSALAATSGTPVAARSTPAAGRKTALAVVAAPCDDFVDLPCTGSASVDSNVADTATAVNPGDFLDVRFADVRGPLNGVDLVLDGRFRIDFRTRVTLPFTSLAGADLQVTLGGFSGSAGGYPFGPVSDVALLQFDSVGNVTVTSSGARYTRLNGVTVAGPGSYTVAGTTVRTAHWADAATYVDLALASWQVAGARPAPGAAANVAGAQGSATVSVVSATTGSVVYAVAITAGGTTTNYIVTATYPGGGGAPTYSAVAG